MGINYLRVSDGLGTGSSRALYVTTSLHLITLNSGYQCLVFYNVGSNNLLWGGSGITVNSANVLFPASFKTWENVEDSYSVYITAESAATNIVITEYAV